MSARCRSQAIMPSGIYRCTYLVGQRHYEHHYAWHRPFTEDDMALIKPPFGWARCDDCLVIKLLDGPYAELPPRWTIQTRDVTPRPTTTVRLCEQCS